MLDTGENYALFVAKLANIALRVLRKKSEFWTNFCSLEPLAPTLVLAYQLKHGYVDSGLLETIMWTLLETSE